MTLPANVPQFRKPPDTERFLAGMSCTQVIKKDGHSMHRNAEQVVYQTSGEIGFHTLGFPTEQSRLNSQPLRQHAKMYHPPVPSSFTCNSLTKPLSASQQSFANTTDFNITRNSNNNNSDNEAFAIPDRRPSTQSRAVSSSRTARMESTRSGAWSSEPQSQRNDLQSRQSELYTSTFNNTTNSSDNKYLNTLHSLDKSFDRRSRRDLYTASLPPKPQYELVWLATANNRAAQQSKPWENKLRRDSNSAK
jgi:hypothetical protein